MEKDLTKGPEWKMLLLFSLPIMAGQLLQQLYNTVDGIVVGNYVSSGALAAVGSCGTIALLFVAIAIGMGIGCGIVVAQLYGAKQMDEMRKAISTILILFAGLGLFFTILGIATTEPVMRYLLGITDEEIFADAVEYFRIYSIGIFFQFIYNAIASMLRSIGDSKATLYFLLVSAICNIGLDLLFVAVFGWGVAGAALATIISQIACAAVSFVYMRKRYEYFRFRLREMRFYKDKFVFCLKMGIPTTIQQIVISSGAMFLQRLVNSFGAATMAAYTVGMRIDQYMSIPSMGFFSGMSAFAGQNTGAGKLDRVKRGVTSAIIMNMIAAIIIGALIYIFAGNCAAIFGVEGESLEKAVEYLRFVILAYPLLIFYLPINGMYQGVGAPLHSMIVVCLALGGRVVGAYTMVYLFGLGYASCWQSTAIGWGLGICYSVGYLISGRWKIRAQARYEALQQHKKAAGPST